MPLPVLVDGGDPSSIAASNNASVAPTSSAVTPTSSAESIPAASPTSTPSPSSAPPRATRTRAASTSSEPVVESPVIIVPSSIESTSVDPTTIQLVTQSAKSTPSAPYSTPSATFWISASPPTASSSKSISAPPVPPPSSSSQPQRSTTFKTVTNSPTPLGIIPSSSSDGSPKSSKTPDPAAGKGSGVISASPFDSPDAPPPKLKKNDGSLIGGVIGGLTCAILLGLLLFFLWKWRARRSALANKRLSFGPYGNGIDASTGSVLVSSVARPGEGSPTSEQMRQYNLSRNSVLKLTVFSQVGEKHDYSPPPRSRYFQPTVDTGRMLLRPIESIEEVSERGSQDVGKKVAFGGQNPFDDHHEIDRLEPTLPTIPLMEPLTMEKIPETPDRARIRGHHRSRSLGSAMEQQKIAASGYPEAERNMTSAMGWVPPNVQPGDGQERYKISPIALAPIRRYPTNPIGMRGPLQRTRRSASVSGINRYPPNANPVTDHPSWRSAGAPGPSPGRRPSFAVREANFPVAPPGMVGKVPMRKASTGSLRERPSPTHWIAPDMAHPLQDSAQDNTRELRFGPANRSPNMNIGSGWGSMSSHGHGHHAESPRGHGDPARNF